LRQFSKELGEIRFAHLAGGTKGDGNKVIRRRAMGKVTGNLLVIRKKACDLELVSALMRLVCALLVSGCAMTQPGTQSQTGKFEFGLIGDLPYSAEDERKFPNLIEDINKANLVL
jgi:hypothetical protein